MTTSAQTRIIHATKKNIAGFDDEAYRGLLDARFGVTSSRALGHDQAEALIRELRLLAGEAAGATRASRAEGKYAPILRALWLSAYHLGLFDRPHDSASMAFVERQTGIAHARFLTQHTDALKAIEALKDILAKRGGVVWPEKGKKSKEEHLIAAKRAVAKACCRRMVEGGFFSLRDGVSFEQEWPSLFVRWAYARGHVKLADEDAYAGEDWDKMAAAAGKRMRVKASARKRRAA